MERSTAWQVVGTTDSGELVWDKRHVTFWDLIMVGSYRNDDLKEQWMMLAAFNKGGLWDEEAL